MHRGVKPGDDIATLCPIARRAAAAELRLKPAQFASSRQTGRAGIAFARYALVKLGLWLGSFGRRRFIERDYRSRRITSGSLRRGGRFRADRLCFAGASRAVGGDASLFLDAPGMRHPANLAARRHSDIAELTGGRLNRPRRPVLPLDSGRPNYLRKVRSKDRSRLFWCVRTRRKQTAAGHDRSADDAPSAPRQGGSPLTDRIATGDSMPTSKRAARPFRPAAPCQTSFFPSPVGSRKYAAVRRYAAWRQRLAGPLAAERESPRGPHPERVRWRRSE